MKADGIALRVAAAKTRDLTSEQNEALRPLVRRLLETRSQVTLAPLIGMSQAAISGFLSGRQGTSFSAAVRICRLAGVSLAQVLGVDAEEMGVLFPSSETSGSDLTVGAFLLKLRRLPGLERWLEENPTALTVSQLARGMTVYDMAPPASRSDGQPMSGWRAFFDDALSGRLTTAANGNQAEAERLELGQMTRSGRRRVRSTAKKYK